MKPRILLLEDEPTSRMFLAAATAELPAEVDLAQSVAQGWSLASGGRHALWLFDANLPDGTGSGLLSRLRASGLRTPALCHTAASEPGERERLLADGFDAVLVKPLSASAWRQALRGLLGQATHAGDDSPDSGHDALVAATPAWDDASAAAALGGSTDNIAALRLLFLDELPAAHRQVMAAAHAGDHVAMRAALHRLRAGCGFVGAARLDAATAALQHDPGSDERLRRFGDAVAATLA